jgi:hypothetical protein
VIQRAASAVGAVPGEDDGNEQDKIHAQRLAYFVGCRKAA